MTRHRLNDVPSPIRALAGLALLVSAAAGCSSSGGAGGGSTPTPTATPTPTPTIQIQTPLFTVQPGAEALKCYYTTLPSSAAVNVTTIDSDMTAVSAEVIVFRTPTAVRPDGTFEDCGAAGSTAPVWVYAADDTHGSLTFPSGVGLPLGAAQPVYLSIHYLNPGSLAVDAQVTVNFTPAAGSVQSAGTLTTVDTQISIAPGSNASVTGQCPVPSGAKFFTMSTHSHKLATSVRINRYVNSNGELLLESLDWEHPTVATWSAPYLTFVAGEKLAYTCDYNNAGNTTVTSGTALTDEQCMTVGYFFPATENSTCINSTAFPQPF